MQTEVLSDDVLSPQSGHATNRKQFYSVSETQHNDLSQAAPLYSEIQRPGTNQARMTNTPDEFTSDAGDPLTSSSPHESVTSSSFPVTMDTHLPESFNSQEHIGSEIFDADIINNETRPSNQSNICTTAILHVDYDNPAMIDSNNDLSVDEDKVLLSDPLPLPRSNNTSAVLKAKDTRRQPPDYQVVMKNASRFYVHEAGR